MRAQIALYVGGDNESLAGLFAEFVTLEDAAGLLQCNTGRVRSLLKRLTRAGYVIQRKPATDRVPGRRGRPPMEYRCLGKVGECELIGADSDSLSPTATLPAGEPI